MNQLELLVKILILLISQYTKNKEILSIGLSKELLDITKPDGPVKTYTDTLLIINKLRAMITGIIDGSIKPDESILVNIEIILVTQPSISRIIHKYSLKESMTVITLLITELGNELIRLKLLKVLQRYLGLTVGASTNITTLLTKINDEIKVIGENSLKPVDSASSPASLGTIDFKNKDSVLQAAKAAVSLISGSTILATGWKAFNDAFQGGIRRGELFAVDALSHNYKSSFTKSLFLQTALFNTPEESVKLPALLLLSLEEELDNIMFFFYMYLKISLDNIVITKKELKELDPDHIAEYVYEHIEKTGFHLIIERIRPDKFGIDEFEATINHYEEKGYEIYGTLLDYPKKMDRKGLNRGGATGTDLLELFAKLRAICSAKNFFCLVPHQLSSKANELLENGLPESEFVKFVAGKNMTAESRQLIQELDADIILKIVDNKYLSVIRNKHRIPTNTPKELAYFELKFINDFSPIPHDNQWYNNSQDDRESDKGIMF